MMASQVPQFENLWGIHMARELGHRSIEDGFISIGWSRLGDATRIPASREAIKKEVLAAYPEAKPGAIPVWAGIIYRFLHAMKIGDGVVYPSKHDRMINLGVVVGECTYHPNAGEESLELQRKVQWLRALPREAFSQTVLNEVGSALTLFQVANNTESLLDAFQGRADDIAPPDEMDTDAISHTLLESTDDFVLKKLKTAFTPEEFERFCAALLEAMGYHARATQFSKDGGVDVIAHRDELGFEPPIIKVQCKQTFNTIGRPEVQKLDGAIAAGEFGLFITLGSFSSEASVYEHMKPNIRLIDGRSLLELFFGSYDSLPASVQRLIPLKKSFIPAPS